MNSQAKPLTEGMRLHETGFSTYMLAEAKKANGEKLEEVEGHVAE